MRIFCDIDGTLTKARRGKWGDPNCETICKIKKLIEDGHEGVIWTGGGTRYAKKFCQHHGIKASVMVGKPDLLVDDRKTIRPKSLIDRTVTPEEFLRMEIK